MSGPRPGLPGIIAAIAALVLAGVLYARDLTVPRLTGPALDPAALMAGEPAVSNAPVHFTTFINPAEEGRMSHVSSLAPLPGGRVAAVWYSGSREGAPDVEIMLSFHTPGELGAPGTWSAPRVLVSRARAEDELGRRVKKLGNPMLSVDADGRLWLFYATVPAGGWSMSRVSYAVSADWGRTWEPARELRLSPLMNITANVKNRAIALAGGQGLLVPVYHELLRKQSYALWLRPDGSYSTARISGGVRAIQPALLPMGPGGRVGALMRNMSPSTALMAESADMGAHWGLTVGTPLPNPDSGLDAVVLPDGAILAVANDSSTDRSRLSLMRSPDLGRSWQRVAVLAEAEGQEYSYPSIVRSTDGLFHVSYTHERTRIAHVAFNARWLAGLVARGTHGP